LWGNCKQELVPYLNGEFKPDLWWKVFSHVDHWFAYNDLAKKIVEATGFSSEKITSINNSIDTKRERDIYDSLSDEETELLKSKFHISSNDIVGIFCSRLYPDKRIDFLLDSVLHVKSAFPNFKFFVVGDGVESYKVRKYSEENNSWFFWMGSQYGQEKIKYFKISDFLLLPGAVGLHIVDSFVLETPIITTKNNTHGVEIDYLVNNKNGIITDNNMQDYINTIIKLCCDNILLERLKEGCRESSHKYTIENMVENFLRGILNCLTD
jgi:glycosyltransferase involved in cell wall biosynthesis